MSGYAAYECPLNLFNKLAIVGGRIWPLANDVETAGGGTPRTVRLARGGWYAAFPGGADADPASAIVRVFSPNNLI
jgi:hypothetical protein